MGLFHFLTNNNYHVAIIIFRNIALAGVNSSTSLESLSTESYIMLERIGRSREHGEVTIGKHALNYQLGLTPQSALSFCLDLLNSGLITQQAMLMKVNTRTLIGELLHLPRFFFCKEQNLLQLMRQLIQVLKVHSNNTQTKPIFICSTTAFLYFTGSSATSHARLSFHKFST